MSPASPRTSSDVARGVAVGLTVLATGASALANDIRLSSLTVKDLGDADTVTVTGRVLDPGAVARPAALTLHCGGYTETVPGGSVLETRSGIAYKAAIGAAGITSFSLHGKSGRFSLTVRGKDVGSLVDPLTFTLDLGGQRMTALYPLKRRRTTHSWRSGQPIRGTLRGRVFRVQHALGNPVITPASTTNFVRNDSDGQEINRIGGAPTTDSGGEFNIEIEYRNPAALDRLDLGAVLGAAGSLTRPGIVSVTPTDDGELQVVAFVQSQSGVGGTVTQGADSTFPVEGTNGAPSGSLDVPAGAVSKDTPGVTFTPYGLGIELPAPLPEDMVALAGAEIAAPKPVTFAAAKAPSVTLSRPKWADRTALADAEIHLLQFRKGRWVDLPGRGKYNATTDRIGADAANPAKVAGTGPVVYAAKVPTAKRLRGRVVNRQGAAVTGVAVLSRTGSMVSGNTGSFEVAKSAVSAGSLEVVQVVGRGTSTALVIAAAEGTAADVEIRVAEQAPLDFKLGRVSGTVFAADGTTPAPGASVSIRLADSVKSLTHDERGTPGNFADDTFSIPDLSAIGVTGHTWSLTVPGDVAEFVSSRFTGNSVLPFDLMLEAQDAGKSIDGGAYTVSVSYTVPGLGELRLYGGFRAAFDGLSLGISDVQLPATYEEVAAVTAVTDAQGDFQVGFRAPVGIPMTAAGATDAATGARSFQFATNVSIDVVLDGPPPEQSTRPYEWTTKTAMPTHRRGPGAAVANGRIYVAGGVRIQGTHASSLVIEEFDPGTNAWTTKAPMPNPHVQFQFVNLNGLLYAVSGQGLYGSGGGVSVTAGVDAYDPANDVWTQKAPVSTARSAAGAAVIGGKIYSVGGDDGMNHLDTLEVYDPALDSWSTKTPMPTPRTAVFAAAVGGKLYVMGGFRNGTPQSVVEVYDPTFDTWTTKAAMPSTRMNAACGVVNGRILAAGGESAPGTPIASLVIYDPLADAWQSATSMPTTRTNAGSAVLGAAFFVFGGVDANPPTLSVVETYAPQ